jgi:hypothetical protein
MSVFCRSLMSCFPGTLLRYFLNDSEMAQVVPIITGITFVYTFHMQRIYILRLRKVATSINRQIPFPLSWTMLSSLLLGMILSVFTCWYHNISYLTFMTCFYPFWYMLIPGFRVSFTPISLHVVSVFEYTLYHVSLFPLSGPDLKVIRPLPLSYIPDNRQDTLSADVSKFIKCKSLLK